MPKRYLVEDEAEWKRAYGPSLRPEPPPTAEHEFIEPPPQTWFCKWTMKPQDLRCAECILLLGDRLVFRGLISRPIRWVTHGSAGRIRRAYT